MVSLSENHFILFMKIGASVPVREVNNFAIRRRSFNTGNERTRDVRIQQKPTHDYGCGWSVGSGSKVMTRMQGNLFRIRSSVIPSTSETTASISFRCVLA